MGDNIRLLRFYFWLLGLFTLGRWALGLARVDYSNAHQVFSIVTLSLIASAHHAAFARAFQGYGLKRAIGLGMTIGFLAQVAVFSSTALSYGLGLDTYFNAPGALNSEVALDFGAAMIARTGGLVANTVTNGIAAAIGWAMGASLPRTQTA